MSKQSIVINVREVNELRNGEPDIDTLVDFFQRRDRFFKAYKELNDYLEFSPMYITKAWKNDGENVTGYMTKQDRATQKGRIKEMKKRQNAKNSR